MRTLGWFLLAASTFAVPPSPSAGQTSPASGAAQEERATTPVPATTTQAPERAVPDTPPAAGTAPLKPVGTVEELMVQIVYPYSDAVFYITTRIPDSDHAWVELQAKTLALAESANLLMMPGRARDQDRWMKDSKLLLDAGTAAFRAAKRKDVEALDALSEELLTACITCHQDYRPNYRRRLP